MNPIIIPFAFSALLLVLAIRTWMMTEKKWLNHLSSWNPLGIDLAKYNQNKIRSKEVSSIFKTAYRNNEYTIFSPAIGILSDAGKNH